MGGWVRLNMNKLHLGCYCSMPSCAVLLQGMQPVTVLHVRSSAHTWPVCI